MAAIKPLDQIGNKFATVTPQRSSEYEQGVSNPSRDWAQATAAAEEAYKQGVTQAANQGRFGRGVKAAGSGKWQQKAKEKGPSRFASGVASAGPDYENGFAPYHQVISSLQLPPRYRRRDPRNLERVAAIAKALGVKKEQTST
jgi:hypothetical protein